MIPPFQLHRPETLADAIRLGAELGDDARYYAGGTELLLVLREGFLSASHLIDLKRVPGLSGVELRDDGSLFIGSTTTHSQVERSPMIVERFPVLAALARNIANVRVRNTGTLGGNLCFAEPHGDPGSLLIAADAELELTGPEGSRTVALEAWGRDAFDVDLRAGEVLVGVRVPPARSTATFAYRRFRALERPTVSAAIRLDWRAEGDEVTDARVVIGCAGPKPQRMDGAEEMLRSAPRASLAERTSIAAQSAAAAVDTDSDAYGPEDYKRSMVDVLVRRAVSAAAGSVIDPWATQRPQDG